MGSEFSSDENGDGPAIVNAEPERLRILNQTAGLFVTAGGEMRSCTPGYDCMNHGMRVDNYEPSSDLDIDGAWNLVDVTKLTVLQVADSPSCKIVVSPSDGHNACPEHLNCS